MRVLMIEPGPNFSVQDVHVGWNEALLESGCTVASLNLNDRLDFYSQAALEKNGKWEPAFDRDAAVQMAALGIKAAFFDFVPDVVLVTSCFFVPAPLLEQMRRRGAKVVLLLTESPYEDDIQLARAAYADVCILNDPTNLDRFRDVCPAAYYQPHAYRPALHRPHDVEAAYKSDVAFVGTGFESRVAFLERIDWSGIDLFLGGNWRGLAEDSPLRGFVAHDVDDCMDNTQTADAYAGTKASFNLYRVEAEDAHKGEGWACGPREVELAATGCWFARQHRPESDDLFPMLPTFGTPGELADQLRWALAHDTERHAAATAARAVIADRTFKNSASRLLQLLTK